MTREEIIHIFENSRLVSEHFDIEAVTAAYIEGLAALREQEERLWIPVTERLPQEDMPLGVDCETVQVLLDDGTVTVGYCNRGLKVWVYLQNPITNFVVGSPFSKSPVKAWKHLSKPPMEDAK